jgi:hypothetical protein
MAERSPKGFPTLTWILPSAGFTMDSDARHTAAEVTQAFDKEITAMATLIEGSGFQAAAVRAIISGLAVLERTQAPRKVFSELAPAVAWCGTFAGAKEPEAIVQALSAMRAPFAA